MVTSSPADEAACWRLFESLRWPQGAVTCPHCGADGRHYLLSPRSGRRTTSTGCPSSRRIWKCARCRRQFSVLVGTVLADSKLPPSRWLAAVRLMCDRPAGITAQELGHRLTMTPKSAGQVLRRMRAAVTEVDREARPPRTRNERPFKPAGDVRRTLTELLSPVGPPGPRSGTTAAAGDLGERDSGGDGRVE